MNLNMIADAAGTAEGRLDDASVCVAYGEEFSQPVVRSREDHSISRRDIDPDALKVLYRLVRNNFTAYLVGGSVRDLLLGRKPKDFDISTNARPEQIRTLFRNCILIGRRFRLAHIRYGDKIIETSTFRRTPVINCDPSDPEADLFQRDDNLFGSPQEDALRRDFTVNGLFYDVETFSIIDYVGGMEDLAARRIRSIGDPCIRFREDPVRMVRAVRFASRLDFDFEAETFDAIQKHSEELTKASPARLLEEITRLFAFSSGEKAVRLLYRTGLLRVILPEVAACLDDPAYDADSLYLRLRALDQGDTVLPDATPALIFSVLLLDPLQRKIGREWGADAFPRLKFDKIHSFLEPVNQRLRFPRKLVDRMVHVYLSQHRFLPQSNAGKRGSIANFVTQESFHESLALAEILATAENCSQGRLNHWRDMLAERLFGREDFMSPANGERERGRDKQPRTENDEAKEEGLPAGKKLSRSARRRRNKRMKKQRTHDVPADGQNRPDEAGPAEVEADGAPDVAISPEPVETVSPAADAVAEEDGARVVPAGEGGKGKPSRSRERRSRSRGKKAAGSENTPDGGEAAAADRADDVFQPLTAAAFYAPLPEPEPAPKPSRKRGGASPKKTAKNKEDVAPDTTEERKPLQPDRADEADTPMHWLDEI